MALTTIESISAALELVDSKKTNLKKAFEDLQNNHASLLSSTPFATLTWSDLDSHFTAIQTDLLHKFSQIKKPNSKPEQTTPVEKPVQSDPVTSRPELRSLCERMDGLGLRKFLLNRPRERTAIRLELSDAWKHAADPGMMVLGALEGFWAGSGPSTGGVRRVCMVLLEELMRAGVEIGVEAKEKARAVAREWKVKVVGGGGTGDEVEEEALGKLAFMHLLATYGLMDDEGFDASELIDCAVGIAKYRQAVDLCRVLRFGDRISDVIQKIISKGKQMLAMKFIFDFELAEKFPPVPLIKAYVTDSQNIAQKVRKSGKYSRQALNDSASKEISALKLAIKIIEDHSLEPEYPKEPLVSRIEKLEKERADRKRTAPETKSQKKKQVQSGNKRMRTDASAGPSAIQNHSNLTVPLSQQRQIMTAGLLPEHTAHYLNPSAGPYSMVGSAAAAPYVASSVSMYGVSGGPLGFPGNPDPTAATLYAAESQVQPSYYDGLSSYGGYNLPPQYHPAYYSQ